MNGSNFLSSSVVRVNGSSRSTTFRSSSRLEASLFSSDVANPGVINITVRTPAPGGGNSNSVALAIGDPAPVSAPTPFINDINPRVVATGSALVNLTISGFNFEANAVALVNGWLRPTTFVNSSRLIVLILASDLAQPGLLKIRVANPGPEAATSSEITLDVRNPNPIPRIASINPETVITGGPDFTLTVIGTGFVNGSTVYVGQASRATTFVSGAELRTRITSQDIAREGTISITAQNAAPGGGISKPVSLVINGPNPLSLSAPRIASLPPNPVAEGSAPFKLTVEGFNFVNGSVVLVNGNRRAATFVGEGKLAAQILASDVARIASLNVQVVNPDGMSSIGRTLEVKKRNPIPRIASITPETVNAGSGSFTLIVSGSNFLTGSLVRVNRQNRTPTFIGGGELRLSVSSGDIASEGTISIAVVNPAPGGGTSNTVILTVVAPTGL